ncbi:MAG: formylglycine-generating enzyme family protein [Rhodospirillales bacterium]|nr:formylglycine-generating enzyme family protein [Rhodospirillales bacterium]
MKVILKTPTDKDIRFARYPFIIQVYEGWRQVRSAALHLNVTPASQAAAAGGIFLAHRRGKWSWGRPNDGWKHLGFLDATPIRGLLVELLPGKNMISRGDLRGTSMRSVVLALLVVVLGLMPSAQAATHGVDVTLKASEAPAASGASSAAPARVKTNKLKQQKQLADADPPKPPAPPPVKPAVKVFPKEVGEVFRDCFDCPRMVVIPAGGFRMGDLNDDAGKDAKPAHDVTIPRPFAVGRYEVTFSEWDACVSAGGCGHSPEDRGWGRDSRPVIYVSWNDAKEYVDWLSRKTGQEYRLLSESEWEYAARAGTDTKWNCGNKWDCLGDVAWYAGNGESMTHPVGEKGANGFGLYDMHGNVWEWVEDCKLKYSSAPADGSAATISEACYRVNRGGSWYSNPKILLMFFRNGNNPIVRDNGLGFRIARTL